MKVVDRFGSMFLRSVLLRMKEMGLTQTALAQRMDASRPYVARVLHGDINITFATAARFAHALQMDFFPTLVPQMEDAPDFANKKGNLPVAEINYC